MKKTMIIHRVILVINIVMFVVVLVFCVIPSFRHYLANAHKSADIGMKPYLKRKPFTLLVDQNFPGTCSFILGADGIPIIFKYQPEGDSATAKICVGLNAEVAISFTDFKNPSIRQVMLINNGTVYQDVGGDGTYDKTFSLSGNAAASQ